MAYFAGGFICRLHSSRKGQPVQLPPKTDSFKQYAERLSEYAKSGKLMREEEYWRFIEEETAAELPHEKPQRSDGSRQHSANGKLYAYRRRNVRFASAGKPGLPYRYARYSSDCRALALRDWTGAADCASRWKGTEESTSCRSSTSAAP